MCGAGGGKVSGRFGLFRLLIDRGSNGALRFEFRAAKVFLYI